MFDALARVTREEGVLRLWRGFEPTALRAMAMNVGQLATYDVAKTALVKVGGDTLSMQVRQAAAVPPHGRMMVSARSHTRLRTPMACAAQRVRHCGSDVRHHLPAIRSHQDPSPKYEGYGWER